MKSKADSPAEKSSATLRQALARSIVTLHLKVLASGPDGVEILERYIGGETDLLAMSFEAEAHLEEAG